MAKASKRPAKYDLKAADRKRNLAIQIGLTAIVVLFAVGLVLWIVMKGDKVGPGEVRAVRVATPSVLTQPVTPDPGAGTEPASTEPKVVLSVYEDFACPHCRLFEEGLGPTVSKLVDNGVIAVDYYMVDILGKYNGGYSVRAANAGYCAGKEDTSPNKEAFRRFHAALFAQQPDESAGFGPNNQALIETARQAGIGGELASCVNGGKFNDMIGSLAKSAGISGTPTIKINGDEFHISDAKGDIVSPDVLVAKVRDIVGDVPGLAAVPPSHAGS